MLARRSLLLLAALCALTGCPRPASLVSGSADSATVAGTWVNDQAEIDAVATKACGAYQKQASPVAGDPACLDAQCIVKGYRYECVGR